ncbi:hypothetical protein [Acrocarpospora sp. B8E8]|uniref:hypothetical protein n=1 Tax=Acrocarpospora sp. B8E8 TaxID=3153572 RepID=UPI00325FBB2D
MTLIAHAQQLLTSVLSAPRQFCGTNPNDTHSEQRAYKVQNQLLREGKSLNHRIQAKHPHASSTKLSAATRAGKMFEGKYCAVCRRS